MNSNPALIFWGALIAGIVGALIAGIIGFLFALRLDRLRQRQEKNLYITSLCLELKYNLDMLRLILSTPRALRVVSKTIPKLRTERIKYMYLYGSLAQATGNAPLYQTVVKVYIRMTKFNHDREEELCHIDDNEGEELNRLCLTMEAVLRELRPSDSTNK